LIAAIAIMATHGSAAHAQGYWNLSYLANGQTLYGGFQPYGYGGSIPWSTTGFEVDEGEYAAGGGYGGQNFIPGGVYVASDGTVQGTLFWVPGGGDIPQGDVIYEEFGDAYWYIDNADDWVGLGGYSVSDGLGDPANNDPADLYGQSVGAHVGSATPAYSSTDGQWEAQLATRTLDADLSFGPSVNGDGQYSTYYGGADVYYEAYPEGEVQLSGVQLAGSGASEHWEALTGQQVMASISVPYYWNVISYAWSVTGGTAGCVVYQYTPSFYSSQPADISQEPANLSNYYFYDSARDLVQFKCTLTVDPEDGQGPIQMTLKSAWVQLVRPECSVPPALSGVDVGSGVAFGVANSAGNTQLGVNVGWNPITVTLPADFSSEINAQACVVQTITSASLNECGYEDPNISLEDTPCLYYGNFGAPGTLPTCDSEFPGPDSIADLCYGGAMACTKSDDGAVAFEPCPGDTWPVVSETAGWVDFPYAVDQPGLFPVATETDETAAFKDTVMFQADSSSIWVPLAVWDWSWGQSASANSQIPWQPVPTTGFASTAPVYGDIPEETADFPIWVTGTNMLRSVWVEI
jgi:hypothetical protein